RRVWSNDLLAGRAVGPELRARSSPALLHDVDGRGRGEGGERLRRDGRLLVQHREGPAAGARSACDGAASTWFRSRTVHGEAPGARPEADRGAAGAGGAGVDCLGLRLAPELSARETRLAR